MRLYEISNNGNRQTNLPLGDYRNDLDFDSKYKPASKLFNIINNLLKQNIQPKLVSIPISTLLATQDWLSDNNFDDPVWEEFENHPVVLDYEGKLYIIDGHHRISRAKESNQQNIPVYYFRY